MEVQVKVLSVSEVRSGVSATTGKPWSQQSVLLGFEDETGESYVYAQVDADVWRSLGYQKDQICTLHLKFRTKRFQSGFVANDIRIVSPANLQQP